jgi:hypothetical protein
MALKICTVRIRFRETPKTRVSGAAGASGKMPSLGPTRRCEKKMIILSAHHGAQALKNLQAIQ